MPPCPPDENSLCLSCGLCCSGAIFARVPVERHDDVASLEAAGIMLSADGGEREFRLPCPAHDGAACRVYASRPTACREYRCDLLRRVKKARIDSAEALRIIGEAVRLNRRLIRAMRELEPDQGELMPRARQLKRLSERLECTADSETRRKLGGIVVQMLALDEFLRRNFGASVLEWSEPG